MRGIILFAVLLTISFALPGVHASTQGCAVDVGAPGIGFNGPVTIGGCIVGTIAEASVVSDVTVTDPENCRVSAETDGTPPVDVAVEPGTELKEGDVVWMFCQLGLDNTGFVTLGSGSWA